MDNGADSLKRILSWLFGVPVAFLVIVVAVANRTPVTFSLDPFDLNQPWFSVAVPLYVLLMGCLILGMLIGGVSAWLTQGKWRKEARYRRHEVHRLELEREDLHRGLARAGGLVPQEAPERMSNMPAPLHPV